MRHRAVVVLDMDFLDTIENNPGEFVRRLKIAVLAHAEKRPDIPVSIDGTSVASVVWSGHVNQTPTLKFVDFSAEIIPNFIPKFKIPNVTLDTSKLQYRVTDRVTERK